MKSKYIFIGVFVLLFLTGVIVYKVASRKAVVPVDNTQQEDESVTLPALDSSVLVNWVAVKGKPNAFNLDIKALSSKYTKLEYEFTYDTEGLIQGGNNGKDPIDVSGKDEFSREIYLGTCSSGTCKPHRGVKKVSLLVLLTDTAGLKSQFSKDFDL